MAKSVTIDSILTKARLYADQRPGGANAFISDTEGLSLVNGAVGELYDLLVALRGPEYYITDTTVALTTDNVATAATDGHVGRYDLPADFYQLLAAAIEWDTDDIETLGDYTTVAQRAHYQNFSDWGRWSIKAYRLRGSQIELIPAPTTDETMRITYVPTFTDLTSGQTFDTVNGWDKLVALKVAIEMREIEEQPVGHLEKLYERELQRVESLAAERDANSPSRVADVQPEGGRGLRWPPYQGWPRVT